MGKEQCQSLWKALACDGNNYNSNHSSEEKRHAAVERFLERHPECGRTENHTAYVSAASKCSRLSGGGKRKTRKSRKSVRKTRGRRRH
jgi:hypothetical protein